MISDIFIYLLKVSAGIGIVSLSYLLIRNDAGLIIKRYFLLLGIILCWIFPFMEFPQLINFAGSQAVEIPVAPVAVEYASGAGQVSESTASSFNPVFVLVFLYFFGMLTLLSRDIFLIFKWRSRSRKNGNNDNIIFTDGDNIFTLFSWIFIPEKYREEPQLNSIILHEQAHIRQKHFIDLIITEITLLVTWFNPFTWLISRMIKENHEHLADRDVLSGGVNPAHYRAQLLNLSLGTTYFSLGQQFNHSITKTRFKMMKKSGLKGSGIIKYIFMIPVILFTLACMSGTGARDQDSNVKGKVIFADNGKAATGASVLVKGTNMGTVTDSNGNFSLDCEKDNFLMISYVGYKTLEVKASWITDEPLELEFSSYDLDLGNVKPGNIKVVGVRSLSDSDDPPVYIVDGKVVSNIDDIDPEDILSVNVMGKSSEVAKKYNAESGVVEIRLKSWTVNKDSDSETFLVVEDVPQFPGGNAALKSYIYENLKYPAEAKQKGIEGKVVVEFIVDSSGKVRDVNTASSTYEGFNEAALNVFRGMPEWKPGTQRGKAVKVKLRVPVEFNLKQE